MKTIILLFSILAFASCTATKLQPNTKVIKWRGKSMLVSVVDSTGETYETIYFKHKLF